MRFMQMLQKRARALLRSDAVDRELGDEMREHLEHLVDEHVARGMSLVAAAASARVLSTLLSNVTAFDPLSFGVATVVMLAVAVAACGLPGRRAGRVDPSLALRAEERSCQSQVASRKSQVASRKSRVASRESQVASHKSASLQSQSPVD